LARHGELIIDTFTSQTPAVDKRCLESILTDTKRLHAISEATPDLGQLIIATHQCASITALHSLKNTIDGICLCAGRWLPEEDRVLVHVMQLYGCTSANPHITAKVCQEMKKQLDVLNLPVERTEVGCSNHAHILLNRGVVTTPPSTTPPSVSTSTAAAEPNAAASASSSTSNAPPHFDKMNAEELRKCLATWSAKHETKPPRFVEISRSYYVVHESSPQRRQGACCLMCFALDLCG
jgi:hypothetical protein